jgi:hypothetical protein
MSASWREGNLCSARRRHEHAPELIQIFAEVACVTDVDAVALAAFHGGRHVLAADRGHDDVLAVGNRQAVARELVAVEREVEVVAAGGALGQDAARAADVAQHVLEVLADGLDHLEVRSENLDADRRAYAGGQHVDAILDRHRPDVRDAREAQMVVHLVAQLVERQVLGDEAREERAHGCGPRRVEPLLRPPLAFRLQRNVVSTMLNGAGSVGEFARPALPNTLCTSGKPLRIGPGSATRAAPL